MDSDDDRGAGAGHGPASAAEISEDGPTPDEVTPTVASPSDVAPAAVSPAVGGMAGLSLPYQLIAAVALAAFGVLGCMQLAMVFLHVAPSNTLTKQHGAAVDEWVYPEFEQNWKLFAPNPLQQNVAVQVRTEIAGPDGPRTMPWRDLSAEDGRAIRGNLLPSHVQQNELRRAWDFYVGSHDDKNRANGLRGTLSEKYVRRLVMLRLGAHDGETVLRIQVRSEVRAVPAPSWSDEKISTGPSYRVLPWWKVTADDLPEGAAGSGEAGQ
ncbi:DUF5819 family protein [Streptomyces sp. NPDC048213]|uniref:DUF5819 family protein n=1 Tax=unclassified Streptomyces TaxID=2593676 RepID=UPI0033C9B25E